LTISQPTGETHGMKRALQLQVLLLFIFVGCQNPKDKSNSIEALLTRFLIRNALTASAINSELPTSLSVPIPRSIRKPNSSARSLGKSSRKFQVRDLDIDSLENFYNAGFSGQTDLQSGGDYIAEILQEAKRDLILISSAYSKAKATPGVCIPGGVATTAINQVMLDEIVSGLEDLGLSNAEAKAELSTLQEEGVLPNLGQEIPNPAMVYKASSNPDYDVELSYSFSDSIGSPVVCPTNNKFQKILKFKSDFSRIFSSTRKTIKSFGTSIDITASITNFSGTGKKDKTVLNFRRVLAPGKGSKTISKTKFILEQCNSDSASNVGNCVTLGYRNEENFSGSKYTTNVKGRTDDEGGYLRTDYYDADENDFYEYEEAFNAAGELAYYSMDSTFGSDANLVDYPQDFGEVGDFTNYLKYYEDTYTFEDQVTLAINTLGTLGTTPGTVSNGTNYLLDEFVIYPTGVNPNTDSIGEYQLGEGLGVNADDLGDIAISEVYVDFYGELSDLTTGLKVWRVTYDTDGFPQFTQLTTTLKQI